MPGNLRHDGDQIVTWTWQGNEVEKTFSLPPRSVVFWQDPPSSIVIEAIHDGTRPDNGVVLDPDGCERIRFAPPVAERSPLWNIGFYTACEDGEGLVVVFSTRGGDVWGRPDLLTGELRNVSGWR
jgi:hypothetical protein